MRLVLHTGLKQGEMPLLLRCRSTTAHSSQLVSSQWPDLLFTMVNDYILLYYILYTVYLWVHLSRQWFRLCTGHHEHSSVSDDTSIILSTVLTYFVHCPVTSFVRCFREMFVLLMIYLCVTAFGMLNGLIGIFGDSFLRNITAVGTPDPTGILALYWPLLLY
jgi:hypothetical protein